MKAASSFGRNAVLQRFGLAGGLLAALVLLVVFYLTVSGAVDRAAAHRRIAQQAAATVTYRLVQHVVTSPQAVHGVMPRAVSYVRRGP